MARVTELINLRFRRHVPVMFALATLATIFAGVWWETDQFGISGDELGAYDDGLQKFTGNQKPLAKLLGLGRVTKSKDIVIIALDDRTLADISANPSWRGRYGNFPYDRRLWADMFGYLEKSGAKAIIFDSVMDTPAPDQLADMALGQTVEGLGIPVYLGFGVASNAVDGGDEGELPKIEAPRNRILHPGQPRVPELTAGADAGAPSEDEFPSDPTPEEAAQLAQAATVELRRRAAEAYSFPVKIHDLSAAAFPPPPGLSDEELANAKPQYPIPAIPFIVDAASGFGTVTEEADDDGKLRRTAFVYTDGDNNYVTLPVAVAADAFGAEEVELSPGTLKLGAHLIPINQDGTAEIDFGGHLSERFDVASVVNVLRWIQGAPLPSGAEHLFKDKYVFIAGFAIGTGDIKSTPLDQSTPGVIKQAATLQNLLDSTFVLKAPRPVSYLFAFCVAFFSVALVLVVRNTFVDIAWPVLLYVGFFVVTGSFLVATKVHVLSALPGLAGTVASVLASTWERLFARKERERLREMFQSYMETDLVDLMVEQKHLPSLDAKSMVVTAFFSDIRGFSSVSEQLRDEPGSLMRLLNRYLSTVTPLLTAEGACIDKYIGDAVVGLFGAPIPHDDHPLRACRAALSVQKAIAELCETFKKEGLPDVSTRIGLNTDTMIVGNIGSDQLLDYTAIGDGMNLAARLETANKEFGTLILIGPLTYEAVKGAVEVREVDVVRVAGKQQAVAIYELLALKGALAPEKKKVIDLYARALVMYRAREFAEALIQLDEALRLDGGDGPSLRLQEKCRTLSQQLPAADWEPVSELSK